MARPLRIEFDGAWHHVMNRGAARRPIFTNRRLRSTFLDLVGEAVECFGVEIHAYCLMTTHYHLLVRTPQRGLSRAMRHIDGVFAQRFNRQSGTDGPLFRGRFMSVLVSEDRHLAAVSRYIHLNPVEAGVVSRPEEYPDSSHAAYAGRRDAPNWLQRGRILALFDDSPAQFLEFVARGIDDDAREFYASESPGPIFGSRAFIDSVTAIAEEDGAFADRERAATAELLDPVSIDEVHRRVCDAFGVPPERLACPSRVGVESAARDAFALLARQRARASLREIVPFLGYRSYASVSKSIVRARERVRVDATFRRRVAELRER